MSRRALLSIVIGVALLPTFGGAEPASGVHRIGYLTPFALNGLVIQAFLFKGATPADLPVEQPTQIELIINARSARALAITIPPSILLRADEVIQ